MNLKQMSMVVVGIFCLLNVCNFAESALPFGVFPILTSGWYYKPNPVESVIFGLIVVKILAIRLASVTGVLPIPYHLNDLFVRSMGKRSLPRDFSSRPSNLTMPQILLNSEKLNGTALNTTELKTMYRLLLGVRRLDTSDCFLKTLCFLAYETANPTEVSFGDPQLLETIVYLTSLEKSLRRTQNEFSKPSIMDVFQKALTRGRESTSLTSCDHEYRACPLTEKDMNSKSILFDLS